ncbi:Penicillin-binding protein 1A, partial [Haemophilus influenzae]
KPKTKSTALPIFL